MADLINVGPVPAADDHVGEREAVPQSMVGDTTQAQVDAAVALRINDYADLSYVTSRDQLNATEEYIDGQDDLRIKVLSKDVPNGVAALQSNGRISPSRINAPNNQRRPRTPWTPSSYPASAKVVSDAAEQLVFTMPVTDPGYPYRLLIQGQMDSMSPVLQTSSAPQINVRVGSLAGAKIASGVGMFGGYNTLGLDTFSRTTAQGIGGYWQENILYGGGEDKGNPYCDGDTLRWNPDLSTGFPTFYDPTHKEVLFTRTTEDAATYDDYQEIVLKLDDPPENPQSSNSRPANYIYGRMNQDGSRWVRFGIEWNGVTLEYNDGAFSPQALIPKVSISNTQSGTVWTARFGTASGKRWFQLLKNGVSVINHQDSTNTTYLGSSYRRWAMGMKAGVFVFIIDITRQANPGAVDYVTINDAPPGGDSNSYYPITVMPVGVGALPVLSGAQTLYVTAQRFGGTGTIAVAHPYRPSLTATAIPA